MSTEGGPRGSEYVHNQQQSIPSDAPIEDMKREDETPPAEEE